MILVVTGGRDFKVSAFAHWALDYWHARLKITCLVHAGRITIDPAQIHLPFEQRARWGVDHFAQVWARTRGVPAIEDKLTDDDAKKFGAAAGQLQNTKILMRHRPDRILGFPGDEVTADMIEQARRARIRCIEAA